MPLTEQFMNNFRCPTLINRWLDTAAWLHAACNQSKNKTTLLQRFPVANSTHFLPSLDMYYKTSTLVNKMKDHTLIASAPFSFQLNAHSGVPVYRQLMDQVARSACAGD